LALTEYLFAILCSKHGNFLLHENSRGAAGRNRPLNLRALLKESVPVADMATQERVASAVRARRLLLYEITRQIDLLNERRAALIAAAVTGKIDVRDAASTAEAA
jgi:type I restriction enzyme S subunit